MTFKLCVIGCGGISNACHGPAYLKYKLNNPDFELTACCDVNNERAVAYKEKFGFMRYYADYKEMLQIEKPDAVCVLVSESNIANISSQVMSMGFPLFVEKPPGKTSAETNRLIEIANRGGVINQVGFNRRTIPLLQELKKMLSEETKENKIQFIRYDLYRIGRFDEDFSDTAVHGIDTVRFLTGADYETVHFSYQALPQYGEHVKNIYMDCIMTSGIHAQLCFCPVSGVVLERAVVNAQSNTWMVNIPIWGNGYDIPGELIHIKENQTMARISGADVCESNEMYFTNGFYHENKDFFDRVKSRCSSSYGFKEARNTMLVKDCIVFGKGEFKA